MYDTEFKNLLAVAQSLQMPAPTHFWLIPVLHRLADIAERLEVRVE